MTAKSRYYFILLISHITNSRAILYKTSVALKITSARSKLKCTKTKDIQKKQIQTSSYSTTTMEEDGYELFHTAHMSVTERLIACLRNETMTDVMLVGDDGIPVPACRYILGSASAAMQPLLYGNFKAEGDSTSVNIRGSNQKSLTALVEFCCSDELNTSLWENGHPLEIVQDTVALAKLAHTYGIPHLQCKVRDFLQPLMEAYPPLSCCVFNLACPEATPDVYEAALTMIQDHAYVALKGASMSSSTSGRSRRSSAFGSMTCLSPDKLEVILSDNDMEADELFLFQQLVAWRDFNAQKYRNINAICKHNVQHLDLSMIDPNEIETTVMQSGFVDATMVVQALMAQAKSATSGSATSGAGLGFCSARGPRGKKYGHIVVEGAGSEEEENCNGTYVHVKDTSSNSSTLRFVKKPNTASSSGSAFAEPKTNPLNGKDGATKTYVLEKDCNGVWRICDSFQNVLYEWNPLRVGEDDDSSDSDDSAQSNDGVPRTGWTAVTGELPVPQCRKATDPPMVRKAPPAPAPAIAPPAPPAPARAETPPAPPMPPKAVPGPHMETPKVKNTKETHFNEKAQPQAPPSSARDYPSVAANTTAKSRATKRFEEKKVEDEVVMGANQRVKAHATTAQMMQQKEDPKQQATSATSILDSKIQRLQQHGVGSSMATKMAARLETTKPSLHHAVPPLSPSSARPVAEGESIDTTTTSPKSPLEIIDGVLDRKIASNKSKLQKSKRKEAARKSSLVDDAPDDAVSALMNEDTDEDPILGTMVGMPERKKKAAWDELLDDAPLKTNKAPKSPSARKVDFVTSDANQEMKPLPPSCILPGINGEPVLVGCTVPMPSSRDVQEIFSQMARSSQQKAS